VKTLTHPTRARIALWAALSLLWILLLAQDPVMDPDHRHVGWVGVVLWVVVLIWLLVCLVLTWRRYRARRF
jgi:hypothetical protein